MNCSGLEFVEDVPQVLDIAAVSSVGPQIVNHLDDFGDAGVLTGLVHGNQVFVQEGAFSFPLRMECDENPGHLSIIL